MKRALGTPEIVIIAVLVALFALGAAFGKSGGSGHGQTGAQAVASQVATIARRDEAIRGLRFKHVPKPLVVTPAQTRTDALRELDRSYPPAHRAADTELLELLGLVPPRTDLRKIEGDVSGQEVSGYYDTHRKRLAIVAGSALNDRVATQITLSHELNHALEDQRFGLHDVSGSGADDAASAYTALVEGTATWMMDEYARRYVSPGEALGSALSEMGAASGSAAGVPPYLQRSLEFSYIAGQAFVQRLRSVAHGWKLVNYALSGHPPRSTEQIMHPDKYPERRATAAGALRRRATRSRRRLAACERRHDRRVRHGAAARDGRAERAGRERRRRLGRRAATSCGSVCRGRADARRRAAPPTPSCSAGAGTARATPASSQRRRAGYLAKGPARQAVSRRGARRGSERDGCCPCS